MTGVASIPRPWLQTPRGRSTIPHCQVIDVAVLRTAGHRLIVANGPTVRLVPIDAIHWVTTLNGVVHLHLADGELVAAASFTALTESLGAAFMRINRRTMVNLSAVDEIRWRGRRGEGNVVLLGGRDLTVTRRYAPTLRQWLSNGARSGRNGLSGGPAA